MPLDAGTEPGEGREVYFFAGKLHLKIDGFEVLGVSDAGVDAAAGRGRHSLVGDLEGPGGGFGVEGGVDGCFYSGGGWDEFFPAEIFGDDFETATGFRKSIDFKFLLLSRCDGELGGDDLELSDFSN